MQPFLCSLSGLRLLSGALDSAMCIGYAITMVWHNVVTAANTGGVVMQDGTPGTIKLSCVKDVLAASPLLPFTGALASGVLQHILLQYNEW